MSLHSMKVEGDYLVIKLNIGKAGKAAGKKLDSGSLVIANYWHPKFGKEVQCGPAGLMLKVSAYYRATGAIGDSYQHCFSWGDEPKGKGKASFD